MEEESVPLPPLPAGQGSQNEACGADGGVPMKKFAEGWIPAHEVYNGMLCVCVCVCASTCIYVFMYMRAYVCIYASM